MQASLPGSAVDAALTVELSSTIATTETPQPKAATYQELKAACAGADAAFLCSQLEASATLTEASSAWMAAQNERLEASKQKPGVDAVGTKPTKRAAAQAEGNATQQWEAAIRDKMDGGMSRQQATRAVAVEDPDLQAAFLAAHNAAVRNQ